MDLTKKIFKSKLEKIYAEGRYDYYITPGISDYYAWNDYIKEYRLFGHRPSGDVPIGIFENTSDKLVLTPEYLGYRFNYIWTENNFYLSIEDSIKYSKIMFPYSCI